MKFTRESKQPLVVLTTSKPVRPTPFIVQFSDEAKQFRWFRVMDVAERGNGQWELKLQGTFPLPTEGTLSVVDDKTVRLEKSPNGFRAVAPGHHPVESTDLAFAARFALLLADMCGAGDPEIEPGLPPDIIEEAKLYLRYRHS